MPFDRNSTEIHFTNLPNDRIQSIALCSTRDMDGGTCVLIDMPFNNFLNWPMTERFLMVTFYHFLLLFSLNRKLQDAFHE